MSNLNCISVCSAVLVFVASLLAHAAEQPAGEPGKSKAGQVSAEEIAVLVKQLDSDKFSERQTASDKLSKIGKPVIDALVEAATGDSLEVTIRSIDILKKMLQSSDEATKEAAEQALEKIAKSDRPPAARRAGDALKALERKEAPAAGNMPGVVQGIQIAVGGRGIQRINVRNVNGVKTIEAKEGGQTVKIVEDPNTGIKMEVTTKKNGKDTTEKYEAKSAKELKKKHPQAYELYSKYKNKGGNFAVQIGGFGKVPIGGFGNVPIRINNLPIAVRPRQLNTIDTAARMLPAWASHLKHLASDKAIDGASKKSNEQLRKKVHEIKDQLAELEKRLGKAIEEAEQEKKEDEDSESQEEAAKGDKN